MQIAADLAGATIKTQVVNAATAKDLAKKATIQGAAMPYFQLGEKVVISESMAIAKHLVRQSARADALLGATPFA